MSESVEWDIDLNIPKDDEYIPKIVKALTDRFGRIPTESEVLMMIYGNPKQVEELWNKEVKR